MKTTNATRRPVSAQTDASLISLAGVEWVRLYDWLEFENGHDDDRAWVQIDATEAAVLTARATTARDAAIQANLLCAAIEGLQTPTSLEAVAKIQPLLDIAAHSLMLFLNDLAGDTLPPEFAKDGRAEAQNHAFRGAGK
jgi:hypothetical protein